VVGCGGGGWGEDVIYTSGRAHSYRRGRALRTRQAARKPFRAQTIATVAHAGITRLEKIVLQNHKIQ
jgi:hypothetical protein